MYKHMIYYLDGTQEAITCEVNKIADQFIHFGKINQPNDGAITISIPLANIKRMETFPYEAND